MFGSNIPGLQTLDAWLVLLFGTMVIEKVMVDVLSRGSSLAAEGR